MKEKMIKGAEFKVGTNNLKVLDTPKDKPMKVELRNDNGDRGQAQIQMYKPGKKGATVLITRSSGESFEVVQTIAEEFVEIFLDAFLKGLVKGEEEFKHYSKIEEDSVTHNQFGCECCAKMFKTKHGLGIHLAWHKKKDIKDNSSKESEPEKQNIQSFVRKSVQQSICELCLIFSAITLDS